jgi:hypothetical protein
LPPLAAIFHAERIGIDFCSSQPFASTAEGRGDGAFGTRVQMSPSRIKSPFAWHFESFDRFGCSSVGFLDDSS